MLTPAFHFQILNGYVDITNQQCLTFIDKMNKVGNMGQQAVDISPHISALTLDTLGLCAFGVSLDAQQGDSDYCQAVHDAGSEIQARIVKPWYRYDFIYNLTPGGKRFLRAVEVMHKFVDNVIQQRKQEIKEKKIEPQKYNDFMTILLTSTDQETGEGLSLEEIRAECNTFMFEGHDTTAQAITWSLYLIALYPDCQTKLQEEVDEILGDQSTPSKDNIKEFRYLDLVIKESLRLYPPVPIIGRFGDEAVNIAGYNIPKGELYSLRIHTIHRDPVHWPDPDAFKPERFENHTPEPFSYIPFSAGPRNCIGERFALQELKIILSAIVKNFNLRVDPSHYVEEEFRVILAPKNGIKLFLEPR